MILGIGAKPIERPGCHELDDLPGLGKVKGEGSQHDEGSPGDGEEKPADPRMKLKRRIGTTPVPGSEEEEKEGRWEWEDPPKDEVKSRKR